MSNILRVVVFGDEVLKNSVSSRSLRYIFSISSIWYDGTYKSEFYIDSTKLYNLRDESYSFIESFNFNFLSKKLSKFDKSFLIIKLEYN